MRVSTSIFDGSQVLQSEMGGYFFLENSKYSALYKYSLYEIYIKFLKCKYEKRSIFS
jgi:hypothetical protein